MIVFGIESSCDETAASIVTNGSEILSNIVATSVDMHTKTGGIVPEKAAREQVKSIIPVVELALREAGVRPKDIDAIAVTAGPGLIGSLLVGVETAKTLSLIWKKPIIPVNHLVAHIYANFICEFPNSNFQIPSFPALALVVSGGHTDLVLMTSSADISPRFSRLNEDDISAFNSSPRLNRGVFLNAAMNGHPSTRSGQAIKWIGGTRDDAAGEAFDKCARLLGLPYPGGPAISAEAANYQQSTINHQPLNMFPRPMINDDNFDWSFSGLKTAVLREVTNKRTSKLTTQRLAAEVQEAIVDVLVEKTLRAVAKFKPFSLLLAGGVAANSRLREKFQLEISNLKLEIDFFVPPPPLCTDNAAYIAAYAFYNYFPSPWEKIEVSPELTIVGQA